MAFCKFCGSEIPEGASCNCAESQAQAAAPAAEASASSNKTGLIVVGAALVIALILIISIISSIAGGGYKKPINEFEKALNKCDGERLAECMMTKDMLKEAEDEDFDELDEMLEMLVEFAEEEYGDDVKFTIKVDDKEKLDKDDLKDIEESYEDMYDEKIDVKKGYEVTAEMTVKGDDGKDSEDIELTVIKVKGEGWLLTQDLMSGLF